MEREQPSVMERVHFSLQVLVFIARALAMPSEVLLRRPGTFGSRYFGFHALAGLMAIPFWTLVWPQSDATWLVRFMGLVLVMLVVIRVRTLCRGARGINFHTRYGGQPWLTLLAGARREQALKCVFEPVLMLSAGALVLRSDQPLGSFLMVSAVGLFVSASMVEAVIQSRVKDLNDALLEQREVIDRWMASRNKRW